MSVKNKLKRQKREQENLSYQKKKQAEENYWKKQREFSNSDSPVTKSKERLTLREWRKAFKRK